jgi:hypothetical protein
MEPIRSAPPPPPQQNRRAELANFHSFAFAADPEQKISDGSPARRRRQSIACNF